MKCPISLSLCLFTYFRLCFEFRVLFSMFFSRFCIILNNLAIFLYLRSIFF